MRFKFIYLSVLWMVACSSGDVDNQQPRVGTLPVKATTSFSSSSSSGSRENTAVILNERYGQILEMSIEPFELKSKLEIPAKVQAESLLVGPGGAYFLVIGKENFAIIHADGSADVNPVDVFGGITSAAFDGEAGRLVIQDGFDAVGLIELSEAGEVINSWVGGPLLDNDGAIEAGAILPEGPLVLSRSDGGVAVVDFEASIKAEKWSFEVFDPGITPGTSEDLAKIDETEAFAETSEEAPEEAPEETPEETPAANTSSAIIWLSPVGDSRHVIARTATQVVLLDTAEQKLVESVTPTNIIGHFDQAVGHVISKETGSGVYKIYWAAKGKLKEQLIKLGISEEAKRADELEYLSILNPKEDALSITYGPYGNYEKVFRLRLSDSRVISMNDTPVREEYNIYSLRERKAELAVSDRHLIYLHHNSLGKIERRSLGKEAEPLLIKGFNFEEAQQSW